ncbi:MAG: hypothetical protein ACTSRU_02895 [Candidatus Hodarchaeales archaeon]
MIIGTKNIKYHLGYQGEEVEEHLLIYHLEITGLDIVPTDPPLHNILLKLYLE